jgi:hypothetical protein
MKVRTRNMRAIDDRNKSDKKMRKYELSRGIK